ncbi:MAG TPA: helix-turn-helix domain-containing protein, partial [Dermatophilaceae bacterium]|nr:helix-turn-helix domain-containing protein [Dermatophilaceae bacterium]
MPAELTLPEDTRSDAAAVRTLAHPLRSRLFGALRRGGPGTATSLAAQLGTNSGATSYHLRKLAEVGLVVDAPGRTGRERHWEAASGNPSWKPSDFPDDEDAATALSWLERDYIRHFAEKAEEWLDHQDDWPAEWIDVLRMADSPALVDVTQMRRLRDELG